MSYRLMFFITLLVVLICLADIPWFYHFFQRIHFGALMWADHPKFVLSMVVTEWKYIWPSLIFPAFIWGIHKTLKYLFEQYQNNFDKKNNKFIFKIIFQILLFFMIILSIRGRISHRSPIRTGSAYFCNDPFLNQMGLNGFYTFLQSAYERFRNKGTEIKLEQAEDSFSFCRKELNRYHDSVKGKYNLYKHYKFNDALKKEMNVIIVLMESMSAEKMSRHGMKLNLTPFLDSLSFKGIYFSRCYSSGIHTFNGIFSVVTGLPSLFTIHPMKRTPIPVFHSIYHAAKPHGYTNLFFTTHDAQFDNMEGFVRANGADYVICDNRYPKKEQKTTLGVPDDVMFRFSLNIYDTLFERNKKFFSIMLTSSDHGPYYIPSYFNPKYKKKDLASVEYADYSLRVFISEASKRLWFKKTLFVFVADHGAAWDNYYSIPYSYVHIPLLFFDPNLSGGYENRNLASQIDVFPSVLSYLGLDFDNYSLGLDLFHEKRNHVVFCADDLAGIMNDSLFLIRYPDDHHEIFKILEKENHNGKLPEIENKLKKALKYYLQCAAEIQYNYTINP